MRVKKQRKTVSVHQKKALRSYFHATDKRLSGKELIEWFKDQFNIELSKYDVSKYCNDASLDKNNAFDERVRRREEHWPQIEEALSTWVINKQGVIPITIDVLRQKAFIFWDELYHDRTAPVFSNGWLQKFLQRHNITSRILHGEASSVADDAKAKMQPIQDEIISQYSPRDIFNCDESALFWRMIPDRSYADRVIPGQKKDKARITAHFCCNADGSERLPVWWIGTAKSPRAFSKIRIENFIIWRWNRKAWMTASIFEEWLRWFDTRMRRRKVLLLLDNFSAHTLAVSNLCEKGELRNTHVVFLPPNTTSIYQPLDQGIIASFKMRWRAHWIRFILHEDENGIDFMKSMYVLHAIRWGNDVWHAEVHNDTIRRCFDKGLKIFSDDMGDQHEQDTDELSDFTNEYQKLRSVSNIQNLMKIENFLNPENENVEDPTHNLEHHIVQSLISKVQTPQEDEEEGGCDEDTLEKITYKEGFEALRILRLFEEQREGGDEGMIRIFASYFQTLRIQEMRERKQGAITHFFESKIDI
ncbi:DDE superfamily endonuclease, CENP-B-like protein [Ascosphaera apis ARSEF 7405]|uniref:DDE superfamily endonuclease, CENP-B-like protein n=1 Tax=Ascosphaera apis ARSEF 7405 TaxID=392613 RepID=A0A167X3B6_9EURO|nr:DDE superfamily endonuclease, CENP-B-like protein [Ascosphaera apis ARSEF 7405]